MNKVLNLVSPSVAAARERARQWGVKERPWRHVPLPELKYELKVRRGPMARCSGCGWHPHEFVDVLNDPVCGNCGKRYLQGFRGWDELRMDVCAQARDWARRVAFSLGLEWCADGDAE